MDFEKEIKQLRRKYARDIQVIGRLNMIFKKVSFGRRITPDDLRFVNSLEK